MSKKKNKRYELGIIAAGVYVLGLTIDQAISFTDVLDTFHIDYEVYYLLDKKKHKA